MILYKKIILVDYNYKIFKVCIMVIYYLYVLWKNSYYFKGTFILHIVRFYDDIEALLSQWILYNAM